MHKRGAGLVSFKEVWHVFLDPWVAQGLEGRHAVVGVGLQQPLEQVQAARAGVIHTLVAGKVHLDM